MATSTHNNYASLCTVPKGTGTFTPGVVVITPNGTHPCIRDTFEITRTESIHRRMIKFNVS